MTNAPVRIILHVNYKESGREYGKRKDRQFFRSVTNLSADKAQLERENKDLFLKLGKMVYAAKTVTEGAQLIIKTLDENTAKIADIDRQIQETTEQ